MLTVLGNHDWHANRAGEITAALAEGGVEVLDRDHRIVEVCGTELGVAGVKGFVGGFPGYNVSVPVLGEDFWVFELAGARRTPSEVH